MIKNLATQKKRRVLSTLVVNSNFGAAYSVRWPPNQKVEPCTQYVGRQIKFWSNVLSTLVVKSNFGVVYSVRWLPNQKVEPLLFNGGFVDSVYPLATVAVNHGNNTNNGQRIKGKLNQ